MYTCIYYYYGSEKKLSIICHCIPRLNFVSLFENVSLNEVMRIFIYPIFWLFLQGIIMEPLSLHMSLRVLYYADQGLLVKLLQTKGKEQEVKQILVQLNHHLFHSMKNSCPEKSPWKGLIVLPTWDHYLETGKWPTQMMDILTL